VSEPVLVVRARRLRAARGVVVARDVTLDAAPVGGPAAWLLLPGLALVAVAAFAATRVSA
jgi:hypothetical protein